MDLINQDLTKCLVKAAQKCANLISIHGPTWYQAYLEHCFWTITLSRVPPRDHVIRPYKSSATKFNPIPSSSNLPKQLDSTTNSMPISPPADTIQAMQQQASRTFRYTA